ncbi:hypothetical protein [Luteibacter sp. E-22]|uniref:hypothetical protein n=1 Tax=Luteibacter sp. E-22 TaxID=3404050 RepID=UPI003CED0449
MNESKLVRYDHCSFANVPSADGAGDWVTHADYKALEDECERLRARVGELARPSNWEAMGDVIEASLLSYRLKNFVDDDGESAPLVDHLSTPGTTIDTGSKEISLITDWIVGDLMDHS